MTVPLITLFTEVDYDGISYIITDWNSNDKVMIRELPHNFVVKSMKIDTRFYVKFFDSYFDLYTNFLRQQYTGNISNIEIYFKYVEITISHPHSFKTIIPIQDKTDPSTEFFYMTRIDTSKPTSNVELYTEYNYEGNKLVLIGQYDTLIQLTQIVSHNQNYVAVVGVLPDKYDIKSIKMDDNIYVQLFENLHDYLLNTDNYTLNLDDFLFNSRPYYTFKRPILSYDFKYNTYHHKYIKIIYRKNKVFLNLHTQVSDWFQPIIEKSAQNDIQNTVVKPDLNIHNHITNNLNHNVTNNLNAIDDIKRSVDFESDTNIYSTDDSKNDDNYETTVQPINKLNYSSITDEESLKTNDRYIHNTDIYITKHTNNFDYSTPDSSKIGSTKSIIPIHRLYRHDNENKKRNKNENENENNFLEFYSFMSLIGIIILVGIVIRFFRYKEKL